MNDINQILKMIDKKTEQVHRDVKKLIKTEMLKAEATAKRLSAVDSGENRNKINVQIYQNGAFVELRADAEHAPFLEFGTFRMAPQPFFFIAYREAVRTIEKELVKIVNKGVK